MYPYYHVSMYPCIHVSLYPYIHIGVWGGVKCPNGKCSARGVARRQRESVHQAAQALVWIFYLFSFFRRRRRGVLAQYNLFLGWSPGGARAWARGGPGLGLEGARAWARGGPGLGLEGGPGLGSRGPRLGLELGAPRLGSGKAPTWAQSARAWAWTKKNFCWRLRRKLFFGAFVAN